MPSIRDVIVAQQDKFAEFKKFENVIACKMRDVDLRYDPRVSGRTGWVWVQEEGTQSLFQAFNPHVTPIANLRVLVGIPSDNSSSRRVVLSIDWSVYPDDGDNPFSGTIYTEKHSTTHEWSDSGYGTDAISVYQRAIVPFRVQVYNDTMLVAMPGRYAHNGGISEFMGEYMELVALFPPVSTNYRRILIYLNPTTNALDYTCSDDAADPDDCEFVAAPVGYIPLAHVLLHGPNGILLEENISDARAFLVVPALSQSSYFELDHHRDIEWTLHIVNGGIIP